MSDGLKPDAAAISAHIHELERKSWLAKSQRWWPGYLFHFTDLPNAVSILAGGEFLSRNELDRRGLATHDIASPLVIEGTPDWVKDYVRLYFRPRTPTQYRNEGMRPTAQRELGGAHCPVPVVFLLRAEKILMRSDTRFSNGNLAAIAEVGQSAAFLASLPFQKIYHDGSLWGISESDKRNIIFHRHAEVVVPTSLDLSAVESIWCRSQAEFETLLHALPWQTFEVWRNKIGVDTKQRFFFSKWTFVTKADLSSSQISLTFNPSQTPGPFDARIEIEEYATGTTFTWRDAAYFARPPLEISLSNLAHSGHYTTTLKLDGDLAYRNEYVGPGKCRFRQLAGELLASRHGVYAIVSEGS